MRLAISPQAGPSGTPLRRRRTLYCVEERVTSPWPRGSRKRLTIETTRNAFAYVSAGDGTFRDASKRRAVLTEKAADPNAPARYDASNHSLLLFDRGDQLTVEAAPEGIRFLLFSGKPIEEPVAWSVRSS
jgi:quercetin 2,3-dioxygenase